MTRETEMVWMHRDGFHPEGIYACEGCGKTYPEYVNGCVVCWDDDLTPEQNRVKYPHRGVRLVVADDV